MLNFQTIKQTIINTEYSLNEPKTLIVLVPIASSVFQKIQVFHIINRLKSSYKQPDQFSEILESREYLKLDTIYKWHALGSLIQTIAFFALSIFHPLFVIPTAFSLYEMYDSANALTHEKIIFNEKLHIIR